MSLGAVTLEIRQRSSTAITVGWTRATGTVTYYELQVAHKDRGIITSTDTIEAYVSLPIHHNNFASISPPVTVTTFTSSLPVTIFGQFLTDTETVLKLQFIYMGRLYFRGKPLVYEVENLQPGATYIFTISVVASRSKGAGSSREITTGEFTSLPALAAHRRDPQRHNSDPFL